MTNESFSDSRLKDAAVADLMKKVKVSEDKKHSALYPEGAPGRVSIRMASGETFTAEVIYPKGHAKNPASDAEVERKFRDMCRTRLTARQCDSALKALWDLEHTSDVGDIVKMMAGESEMKRYA